MTNKIIGTRSPAGGAFVWWMGCRAKRGFWGLRQALLSSRRGLAEVLADGGLLKLGGVGTFR